MNAEAEYAQHQQGADEALRRIAEGDAWLAWFMENIDAAAQPTATASLTQGVQHG